jgi:hypothetical protein
MIRGTTISVEVMLHVIITWFASVKSVIAQIVVFYAVTPYNLVHGYVCFSELDKCLHHQC